MSTLITFLASFLIWIMFASLFYLYFSDGKIKKEQVLHAIFAFFLAWIIANLIKIIFPTVRPFEVNGQIAHTLFANSDGAFPSGHSAAAFALAVTVWFHDKKVGVIYLLTALIVGISRVLGNVHYPIDILGGAILGSLVAFAIEKVHLKKLLKRA